MNAPWGLGLGSAPVVYKCGAAIAAWGWKAAGAESSAALWSRPPGAAMTRSWTCHRGDARCRCRGLGTALVSAFRARRPPAEQGESFPRSPIPDPGPPISDPRAPARPPALARARRSALSVFDLDALSVSE